jgi:tubulin--tyrosine ligase
LCRRAIFAAFEPLSSDEEDEDGADEDNEGDEGADSDGARGDDEDVEAFERRMVEKTARLGLTDDSDEEETRTGVMTSQLRHFVIQVSQIVA